MAHSLSESARDRAPAPERIEAAESAARLFSDDLIMKFRDAQLADRISFAEDVHWFADQVGSAALHALGDAIASPTLCVLATWLEAYVGYRPFATFVTRAPNLEAVGDLRDATKAVLVAEPQSIFELLWKIRIAALIGIHARLRRGSHDSASTAYSRFREHLDRLPLWVVGGALVHNLRPEWINSLDPSPNRDARLVLDAIRDAGPGWQAAVAADIERLRARGLLR